MASPSSGSSSSRPAFEPFPANHAMSAIDEVIIPVLAAQTTDGGSFVHLIHCSSTFPVEFFPTAMAQLIHHPEYNSTLILRSETLQEHDTTKIPPQVPILAGHTALSTIHRRLLPRRPGRDAALEQYCTLYAVNSEDEENASGSNDPSVMILTPVICEGGELPYYHPAVHHLAFRQFPTSLRIEVIALSHDIATDPNSRLYRTCLALLDTFHRYLWGAQTNYQKRVLHDCLVPREPYQDLYLVMRERHKHLVDTWQEATDPLKHVFEDIGIATYLMMLWKDMYSPQTIDSSTSNDEPWRVWGRPPKGFLDLGCGNGLLTHILTSEGYEGTGFDLRARTSWEHYPESTQSHLVVQALDPVSPRDDETSNLFREGVFLIGNHADELTPWLPVLATRWNCSAYISIPCCSWMFDSRFTRDVKSFSQPFTPFELPDPQTLNLGGGETSSYARYRIWLAGLSTYCGWEVESDTLRIPSTRNWAIVGRKRTKSETEARENVEGLIQAVHERGIFKTRHPEGKAGDH